jgi:hypothetical protein
MSITASLHVLPPSESAFLSVPAGNQYPAEINQIYQRAYATTKKGNYNVTSREQQQFDISNYTIEQLGAKSSGLNCKNTNTLGGRPDKNTNQYGGACSRPRYPYSPNAAVTIAMEADARQDPSRYADHVGMFNYSMGDVEVSTSLLGSPPESVRMAAAEGSTVERNGVNTLTGLKGLNYPPTVYSGFYEPLPRGASMTLGSCVQQQNGSNSLCNNGQ